MTLPLSVFIIAVDEADRIGRTIESVRHWADEVIVIDSGSVDGTPQAAEKLGARVIHHDWPGYGMQKRFGEEQCRHDWLLNLDADEVISPALAEEIQTLFVSGEPAHSAWTAPIVEILPGRAKPTRFAHRVNAIRLYNRRYGRFSGSTVHDSVIMREGAKVGALQNIVEHRSSRGLSHSVFKLNRYSTMQAENMLQENNAVAWPRARLLAEFPVAFLKAYLLRGYAMKGRQGFVNSVVYAFSRFLRIAKYLEMKAGENSR